MRNRFFAAAIGLLLGAQAAWAAVAAGEAAPAWTLKDIAGNTHTSEQYKGKHVVLEWMNPDCPFVKRHYDAGTMQKLQQEYTDKGVIWLTVNSSAPGKQGNHSAEEWAKIVSDRGVHSTAVLLDPDGTVGRAFGAKTTPHMFVIGPEGHLLYQGALDDKPSTNASDVASKNYVRSVLDNALAGQPIETASTESYGCSVKY